MYVGIRDLLYRSATPSGSWLLQDRTRPLLLKSRVWDMDNTAPNMPQCWGRSVGFDDVSEEYVTPPFLYYKFGPAEGG